MSQKLDGSSTLAKRCHPWPLGLATTCTGVVAYTFHVPMMLGNSPKNEGATACDAMRTARPWISSSAWLIGAVGAASSLSASASSRHTTSWCTTSCVCVDGSSVHSVSSPRVRGAWTGPGQGAGAAKWLCTLANPPPSASAPPHTNSPPPLPATAACRRDSSSGLMPKLNVCAPAMVCVCVCRIVAFCHIMFCGVLVVGSRKKWKHENTKTFLQT